MRGSRRCIVWAGAALLIAALSAAACNRSPNTMMGYEKSAGGVATNLYIANPSLQKRITLVEPADSRRVNDLLRVKVRLQNRSKKTAFFEYKFQWFDGEEFEIEDKKAHWTPAGIVGRNTLQVQETAPHPDAVTFKLLVRKPEPVSR